MGVICMQILLVDLNVVTEALRRHDAGDRTLPRVKLLARWINLWVAVDNSTGACWTQAFGGDSRGRVDAHRWLGGKEAY